MARLLVMAVDKTHPDPELDKSGCFKLGDIVTVQADDHVWGSAEGLPNFIQVDIADVSVAEMEHLANYDLETSVELMSIAVRKSPRLKRLVTRNKDRKPVRQRRYSIDVNTQQITDKRAI